MSHQVEDRENKGLRMGPRCFIGEFAIPQVRWIENASCPVCGCTELMDAGTANMALCISCNRFVKLG